MQRRHRQLIDIDVIKGRVIVRGRAPFQELRLHLRVRDRHDRHRAVLMEVLVMYLTVQQLRVEVEVLSVYMPEDSYVLSTPLDRKRNGKRVTVSPREVVVLGCRLKRRRNSEMKSAAHSMCYKTIFLSTSVITSICLVKAITIV